MRALRRKRAALRGVRSGAKKNRPERKAQPMVRFGIAGIGVIARDYAKLIVEGRAGDCEIAALSSRSKAHMEQLKEDFGLCGAALFTDYRAMLDSGAVDAVIICTPHSLHPSMAKDAVERGIHALIEKPIGVFPDEVEDLLRTLRARRDVKSGVLYCRRAGSAFQKLHGLAEEGFFGRLKRASWIITNLYRPQAYHSAQTWKGTYAGEGGGLLLTQASHQLDLLLWMLGAPESVHAFCGFGVERDIEVEDDAVLHLRYPDDLTAQFIASSREFPGSNRLELSGSAGQAVLDDDRTLTLRTSSSTMRTTPPSKPPSSRTSFRPSSATSASCARSKTPCCRFGPLTPRICPLGPGRQFRSISTPRSTGGLWKAVFIRLNGSYGRAFPRSFGPGERQSATPSY